MRRVTAVILCLALSIVGAAVAQAADTTAPKAQSSITTGELSALIIQAATGSPEADFDARSSLLTAKRLNLVPKTWQDDAVVTAEDLDAVLTRLGAAPSEMLASDAPVTAAEAARQIENRSEAIRTMIATGTAAAEPAPSDSPVDTLGVLDGDSRAVRNLSASEF